MERNTVKRSTIGGIAAVLMGATIALGSMSSASAADQITHDATLSGETASVTMHLGADGAGHLLSVLILDKDGNLAKPAADDIVYLNEAVADEAGEAALTFDLPTSVLDNYAIAANLDSGDARYLHSLDPQGDLPDGGDPTDPTDPTDPSNPGDGGDPGDGPGTSDPGQPGGPDQAGGQNQGNNDGSLSNTGAELPAVAAIGVLVLLLAGAAFVLFSRRRSA